MLDSKKIFRMDLKKGTSFNLYSSKIYNKRYDICSYLTFCVPLYLLK